MKLKEILEKTTGFFREKGSSSARLDAELLLSFGLGIERIRLYIDFERPITDDETVRLRELVRRRGLGEPVAYIVGKKDFFNHSFEVGPGVLIPRPETEHLVENALTHAKSYGEQSFNVVDLGCGSGCIGLSVLLGAPQSRLIAVDASPAAIAFARKNAERLLPEGAARILFVEGDASSASTMEHALKQASFDGVDVLLANPPYIASDDSRVETNVKKFEPESALFAPEKGLAALKTWSSLWVSSLNPGGLMAMEMGLDQGPEMLAHFRDLGLGDVKVVKDLSGHDRIIQGVRHG